MDFSTLNLDTLHKFHAWECSGRWSVGGPGSGCFLDPPGYPSYFLRSVYLNGNTSHRTDAPEYVIADDAGVFRIVRRVRETAEWRDPFLRRLWVALPLDHVRVQMWIRDCYRHFKHCYNDDRGRATDKNDNGCLIFPVPYYKLRQFHDDHRFSDEWRTAEKAAIEAHNADVIARAAEVAIPENHSATRLIQKFYPDHQPDLTLIANPPDRDGDGDWWQTECARPSIDSCQPRNGIGARDHATQWCQWCGRNPGDE